MKKRKVYTFHPLAMKYPLMDEAKQAEVIEDMKENGFDPLFPIVLYEKLILAGRGRYICAGKAGATPVYKNLPKGTDPEEFVERENELRNHYGKDTLEKLRHQRIERILRASRDGKTEREIAKAEGVSKTQVHADLQKATDQGKDVGQQTELVRGGDQLDLIPQLVGKLSPKIAGKVSDLSKTKQRDFFPLFEKYGASKAYDMVMNQREPGDEDEDAGPKLPKDVANALADTWHLDCAKACASMRKQVKTNINWSEWLDRAVIEHLKLAEEYFVAAAPKKLCPRCEGQKAVNKLKCTNCRGCGYLAAQA